MPHVSLLCFYTYRLYLTCDMDKSSVRHIHDPVFLSQDGNNKCFLVWGGNTVGVAFQVMTGVDCELRKKHAVWDDNYMACSWKWKMRGELDLKYVTGWHAAMKYVTGWHAAMKGFIFRCLLRITSFIGCLVFSSLERHWNCCSTCRRMLSVCGWPGRFQEVMNLIIRKDTRIPPPVTGHSHKESVRWRCVFLVCI